MHTDSTPTFSPWTEALRNERPPEMLRQHSLPRRRSRYILRKNGSDSNLLPSATGNIFRGRGQPLAMQRWQNSPPEDEAASLTAIYNALDNHSSREPLDMSRTQSFNAFQNHRGPSSTTSLDSGASGSSLHSINSSRSNGSQTNRRSRTPRLRAQAKGKARAKEGPDRIFKCTFCCDTFKHKYDWARHEKSLHLNMEEWQCTPHGGSVLLVHTGRVHCAYCSALDPNPEHLQQHNHFACQDERSTPRVFRRKDHLVQHLRLVHGLETLPLIDDWKIESMPVVSRCGFCNVALNSWDERTDHLAAHFREGKTMSDWHGDHGFDAAVTARVTKSFPPYLIASQSTTIVPFSATNHDSLDQTKQILARMELLTTTSATQAMTQANQNYHVSSTQDYQPITIQTSPTQQELDTVEFADVLALYLGQYARQQALLGITPTDEMFQRESRRVLYHDGDDEWNQTNADNPDWLKAFRAGMTGDGKSHTF
ncbi:hypothetical protein P153DRAFT_300914 [Dothidotthia symphoricarpi CBS 119687]|uniref:C2H2-type domain-containing protein n=1 Tax=Dothidotthia symphoricarpi CBS 119687 TaxID=1392245 RepID=A0A6A5ZZQ5_9PLEO|nr:uncharacterized protein P153DRAFT_300914 [Dothidotthia symphoricarpi CBS 119687]KAF2125232.1 hypothetical protein P153DRAFT_300914 [Dothidotthia symphoricarpi CBS 119687]